ncbi:RDD family protein [Streptomonospora wellingtoniae]|uniref:RDD family protein n=1 Tax=Streptomonospora wellingtoniae TaxID=3075544 RepID=A0ABU2KV41_9ACTN|nr:RDD family protein [Streptomonospora sp. DSM 45055]MDT0303123.1 RDD family protein [Streptomonospora sp. DSM 45055]
MSFPPHWNDGTTAPGDSGRPPPHRPHPPPYVPPAEAVGPVGEQERYRLASWGRRAVARTVDGLAVGVPVAVLAVLVSLVWAGAQSLSGYGEAVERNSGIVYGLVGFVMFVAYETVCVHRWRRTLGKHLMGLRVAPLDGAGRQGPIPVASMAARAAVFNLANLAAGSAGWAFLCLMLMLVPCVLWPLWDRPNRQALHDKVAGTVVVRTD